MYKVAIVDDDRIIRRGLASVIPWEENGLQFVGEASDGETGLELIEKHKPQIVLSDIKMPFMDGLEMARIIKAKIPNIKFIFLTGFEDFGYAHEALRLKAFDYLLKPVETESLIVKLKQAAAEWEDENHIEQRMKESSPFIETQFLSKLKTTSFTNEELTKALGSFGFLLRGTQYSAVMIKLDAYELMEEGNQFDQLKADIGTQCLEIFRSQGFQAAILNAKGNGHLVVFLSNNKTKEFEVEQLVKSTLKKLQKIVEGQFSTTLTITTGTMFRELAGIGFSYQEADSAMGYRHIIGKNTVYSINDIKPNHLAVSLDFHIAYDEIVNLLKLGLTSKIEECIEETKNRLLSNHLSLQDAQLIAIRIVGLIFHESSKWTINWQESTQLSQYEVEILRLQTIHEIFEKVKNIACSLALFIRKQNEKKKTSLVNKAIEYIEKNYYLEDISLQKIAEKVYVNPAYLSNLFKVEKGFNFGDFLLETRMKAAMELFRQTDLKTYEVAIKTGYSNPQYFSICFKKYTGYSPIQFKKLK